MQCELQLRLIWYSPALRPRMAEHTRVYGSGFLVCAKQTCNRCVDIGFKRFMDDHPHMKRKVE